MNSGAFDDLAAATARRAHRHGAWVHVDGAFGLWAAANPGTRHLTAGIENADSWATDGHKWLNVPYDVGYAFCAHPRAHAAAMSITAAYLTGQDRQGGLRAPGDYVVESSRRARGFATWAALRELGRERRRGPGRAVLWLGAPLRRTARRDARRHDRQRGRAQSGSRQLRRRRPDRPASSRASSVQGECWMGATHLARPASHAHLGLELAYDRGRCRPAVAAILAATEATR